MPWTKRSRDKCMWPVSTAHTCRNVQSNLCHHTEKETHNCSMSYRHPPIVVCDSCASRREISDGLDVPPVRNASVGRLEIEVTNFPSPTQLKNESHMNQQQEDRETTSQLELTDTSEIGIAQMTDLLSAPSCHVGTKWG